MSLSIDMAERLAGIDQGKLRADRLARVRAELVSTTTAPRC